MISNVLCGFGGVFGGKVGGCSICEKPDASEALTLFLQTCSSLYLAYGLFLCRLLKQGEDVSFFPAIGRVSFFLAVLPFRFSHFFFLTPSLYFCGLLGFWTGVEGSCLLPSFPHLQAAGFQFRGPPGFSFWTWTASWDVAVCDVFDTLVEQFNRQQDLLWVPE